MENIKVVHVGEDYGTIVVNGDEFECSLALALAIKKEIAYQKKNMTWYCKDDGEAVADRCNGKVVRSYNDLAEAGEPYCEVCGGDMYQK